MTSLDSALAAQRTAAESFAAAARKVPDAAWNVPRAPGKWSPAQVADHVGVSTRVARDAVAEKAGMAGIPAFLRWLPRALFFNRVIEKGFPEKGRGPAAFAPASDPLPRTDLLQRLDAEVEGFASDARAAAQGGKVTFEHAFFGRITIADYVMFNARHLDHHREQLRSA